MKRRLLLYGEHPFSCTGNGNMMRALLNKIDYDAYEVLCVVTGLSDPAHYDSYQNLPFTISADNRADDIWAINKLYRVLQATKTDICLVVGLDMWRLNQHLDSFFKLRQLKKFKFSCLAPYDSPFEQKDWFACFNALDYPSVYSEYGYNFLKSRVPEINYFHPPLNNAELFSRFDDSFRELSRTNHFQSLKKDDFIFGFVGPNQHRKQPHKLVKAFIGQKYSPAAKETGNSILYMHTNLNDGIYNIPEMARNWGAKDGDLIVKTQNVKYDITAMVQLYNSFDCLVLPSCQEGLSWTVVEAMLCGVPVIATRTTAHIELLKDGAGVLVPCTLEEYLSIESINGPYHMDSIGATVQHIAQAMLDVRRDSEFRAKLSAAALKRGKEWLAGVDDINKLLETIMDVKPKQQCIITSDSKGVKTSDIVVDGKIDRILFAQHSSAGDVLMSTRCFKDIVQRHGGKKIDFMTMSKYMDLVEGNPYIDRILSWDESLLKLYKYVYNPHGDIILPGHWGRNSNSVLGDFYWKILDIAVPDNFYIPIKKPEKRFTEYFLNCHSKICIVHTTGGDAYFRTYKYMADVCMVLKNRGYATVQVGGLNDYPAGAMVDARGLSYAETAWIVTKAALAITVDSYVTHLAGALGINQIALYGSGNAAVCRPVQVMGKLLTLSPDYVKFCPGLGPCSGSIKTCPVLCTGYTSPDMIIEAAIELDGKPFGCINGVSDEDEGSVTCSQGE